MYTTPIILPMDSTGRVYELQDKNGQVLGTGSREVCERLMCLFGAELSPGTETAAAMQRNNVRAAITI
jgi:hypothetical protein